MHSWKGGHVHSIFLKLVTIDIPSVHVCMCVCVYVCRGCVCARMSPRLHVCAWVREMKNNKKETVRPKESWLNNMWQKIMVLFPQETMLRHSWSKRLWRACREPRKKTVAVFQDEPRCHMFMNNLCQLNMSMFYIYYSNMLGYFMKLYWISNLVLFVRSRLKSIRISRFPLHQSICMRSIGSFLWWRETSD